MRAFHKLLQFIPVVLTVLLTACGGGSAGGGGNVAGIGGTGQIASGTITGFGSIFMNGIEFNIDTTNCTINGSNSTGTACQSNLQLGMVVEVNGTFNSTAGTGSATQLVYNDDVIGPVSSIVPAIPGPADVTRTFTVLNTSVQVDSASTKFSGNKGFSTLVNTDVVEISGFFDNTGILHATYVDTRPARFVDNSTIVEVKGRVSGVPAGGARAAGDSFVVTGVNNMPVNITLGSNPDLSDITDAAVQNNTLVEVRGTYESATNTLTADRVQAEDNAIGADGDEVSIEGLITNFTNQGDFQVDGQQVDASSATFSPITLMSQLANGIKVEVEGSISGQTLIADKIESRGNDLKIEARVSVKDINAGTVTVQFASGDSLVVLVNNQTQMEDKTDTTPALNLSIIQPDDFLEIRGFLNTDPMIDVTASEIRRNTPDDDVLQGPLDDPVTTGVVSILRVQFTTDVINTSFDDGNSDSATFYLAVQPGCIVKVEDGDAPATPPDSIADEISLESCP